ncbi:uncharacterized protein C8R40DRAFT_1164262 [Lentinula edodes]|uniref:uncharacterized protein n=1 Tax=Lentinula edodes TaxID=5353 RepID=UPI001E8D9101|nr:uncharacterized protein C8R40DRAFT_1164262 [Lentinula edodes]KAH7867660.1 hypothetical protein C8R40DRAFT_1164262 [Lentinula edodes]
MARQVVYLHLHLPRYCTSLGLGKGAFQNSKICAQTTSSSQPTTVSFSHYCSVLKNKAIVDEAEKLLKDFKPVNHNVSKHIKVIVAFNAKAIFSTAKETEEKIDMELRDLQATLVNNKEAHPFQNFTVLDTGKAHPCIIEMARR